MNKRANDPALLLRKDGTKIERVYSRFEIKEFTEDSGEFEGIASTPSTDRMGDIVEPKGALFTLPLPLLWQHDAKEPIGLITKAKVTGKEIRVWGQVYKNLLPSIAQRWTLIKAGLVRGLSIGFAPKDWELLDEEDPWGGVRFNIWDWLELSSVTIPANAEANMVSIKAYDDSALRASPGAMQHRDMSERLTSSPAAAGITDRKPALRAPVSLKGKAMAKRTLAEQISGFEAKRAALVAANQTVMDKSEDEGRTLTVEEKELYDNQKAEIDEVDEHLARLRAHEAAVVQAATAVEGTTQEQGTQSRSGEIVTRSVGEQGNGKGNGHGSGIVIMSRPKVKEGLMFTRYAMALARSRGNLMQALEVSKMWKDTPEVEMVLRAAVAVGTTTDSAWAAPLVQYQVMASEFIELLRPAIIMGQMDGFRRVPFNVSVPATVSGTTAGWVGETKPKPVTRMSFELLQLGHTKIASIVVLSEELVRLSNPSAERIVGNDMREAIAQYMDQQFIDPTVTEIVGVRPASITNGAPHANSTGSTIAQITADVSAAFASFSNSNVPISSPYWIMNPRSARYLSLLRTTQDVFAFPGVTQNGGTFFGIPVITSNNVPMETGGNTIVVLVAANEILLADEGGVTLDSSREASLQIDSAPSEGAATLVSLWQNNLVGLRAERMVNYKRRRDEGVYYIDNVAW